MTQDADAASTGVNEGSDEEDYADDCTSDENCDHLTHYKGCPMSDDGRSVGQ